MDRLVNLKDLRENLGEYADRVAKGDSFVVMKRSRPLFKISPVDDDGWETVVDFTTFQKGGLSANDLLKRLKSI